MSVLQQCQNGRIAQDSTPPVLQNPLGRSARSLDGTWQAIVDPYETGFYDYRRLESHSGYFEDLRHEDPNALIEYDFDRAWELQVPGDWNTQRAELSLYEGTVWYRRVFELEPRDDRRYFLHFGAVNEQCIVYLNGTKLGTHDGGFTPFDFEVGSTLRAGRNSLVVKVDNSRRVDGVPTVATDWWSYGGITRSVDLIETPRRFLRDYFLRLDPGRDDHILIDVQADGEFAAGDEILVEIEGLEPAIRIPLDADGWGSIGVGRRPELWSPGAPKLYQVKLQLDGETITDQVGFRRIETRGSEILLNGEALFLRGISLHEEILGESGGRAHSAEHAEALLDRALELGCNFVRLAHYPHNEHMVRAADRLGLLVWEEIPVYWTIDWANPATLASARRQLTAMIQRDRNRAATILWSVGNETPLSEERLAFMSDLVATARSLDSTRLITAALEQHREGDIRVLDDPLGALLDVAGVNEYFGWYEGELGAFGDTRWRIAYDKPLIVSEFGAGAKQGLHGTTRERWTEEYQAAVYGEQITMLRSITELSGMTPWVLKDFRSPRRPLGGIQDFWNRKGLISETGIAKAAFGVLRAFYEELRDATAD